MPNVARPGGLFVLLISWCWTLDSEDRVRELADCRRGAVTDSKYPAMMRTLTITSADVGPPVFEIAVFEGVEPAALRSAVAARASLSDGAFYLTMSTDRAGVVVPLSAAIPDGTTLVLHRTAVAAGVVSSPLTSALPAHVTSSTTAPQPSSASGSMLMPLLVDASNTNSSNCNGSAPPAVESLEQEDTCAAAPSSSHRRSLSFARGGGSNQLEGVERLTRLTTDLANERTLLAWTRTTLAAIRTTFTYLELSGSTVGWLISIKVTEVMTAVLVVATALTGAWRYFKIKDIIGQKVPPRDFGRVSMRPLSLLVVLTSMVTALGVCSQQWVHGSNAGPAPGE